MALAFVFGFAATAGPTEDFLRQFAKSHPAPVGTTAVPASPLGPKILKSARALLPRTLTYDAAYKGLKYPMGDVPLDRGVCTDVVVRALRGVGIDLQKEIHEDMGAAFPKGPYPRNWGMQRRDRNIDHRRVPNQMIWFARHARALSLGTEAADLASWQPGDIVFWNSGGGTLHVGVLGENGGEGPTVIHHLAGHPIAEEPVLTQWPIIGHFRVMTAK